MQYVIKSYYRGKPTEPVFVRDYGGNRPAAQRFTFGHEERHITRFPNKASAMQAREDLRKLWADRGPGAARVAQRAVVVPAHREGLNSDGPAPGEEVQPLVVLAMGTRDGDYLKIDNGWETVVVRRHVEPSGRTFFELDADEQKTFDKVGDAISAAFENLAKYEQGRCD